MKTGRAILVASLVLLPLIFVLSPASFAFTLHGEIDETFQEADPGKLSIEAHLDGKTVLKVPVRRSGRFSVHSLMPVSHLVLVDEAGKILARESGPWAKDTIVSIRKQRGDRDT